jgi:mannose-6-phosphate isomerase class I
MGAHPDLPSRAVLEDGEVPLNALIDRSPEQLLGESASSRFRGRLPYLFKVLSAAAPLSIQAHPSRKQAEAGFDRENRAGIPLGAKYRNYKDDNHKPELIAAVTDFYALRGFRPLPEIAGTLRQVPELQQWMPDFTATPAALRSLYETVMHLPQPEVDAVLDPLIRRLTEADRRAPFARSDREYWVLRADRHFSGDAHRDRGLFSIYLLNLVPLRPGEALYLSAGILHAYLEGSGMEIMANSNNVLRGGLTPKHVDVAELLQNVVFEGAEPEVLRPVPMKGTPEWAYQTPAEEFELRRIELRGGQPYSNPPPHSAEIVILTDPRDAAVTVRSGEEILRLARGGIFFVPSGVPYQIGPDAAATLYKATVP